MKLIDLQKDINSDKKEIKKIKKKISEQQEEQKKMFLELQNKLVSMGFYKRYLIKSDKTIEKNYSFSSFELPYRYCGEGDFMKIIFKVNLKTETIDLLEQISWEYSGEPKFLCSFSINIIEDYEILFPVVREIIENREKFFKDIEEKKLQSEIERAEELLKKLKLKK